MRTAPRLALSVAALQVLASLPSAAVGARVPRVEPAVGLVRAKFVPKLFARPFLRSLDPAETPAFLKRSGFGAARRRMGGLGEALAGRFQALPFETSLHGPLRSSDIDEEHAAFLLSFTRRGAPAGLAGYVVRPGEQGNVAEILNVYFDQGDPKPSGISTALLDFLSFDLDPVVDVRRQTLKADYAGRYVWAKHDFRFEPGYRYWDVDGSWPRSVELIRRNLARFLAGRGIPLESLLLRGSSVRSLEQLSTPADFAELVHADGLTIRLRPLVNHDTLGSELELPVGKAFALADYRTKTPPMVRSQGGPQGNKFRPDAMPYWPGYREGAPKISR